MTNQEVRDWVKSEYERAENIKNTSEANQIRYRAKIIFDKRFPNPDICPCCKK